MIYVLDTHALIWFLTNNSRLGKKASKVFDDLRAEIIVPLLVLAEIKFLFAKRRTKLGLNVVIQGIKKDTRFTIHPLDLSVVEAAPEKLDIHDALICGTAIIYRDLLNEDVRLITADKEIIKSKVIETIW